MFNEFILALNLEAMEEQCRGIFNLCGECAKWNPDLGVTFFDVEFLGLGHSFPISHLMKAADNFLQVRNWKGYPSDRGEDHVY